MALNLQKSSAEMSQVLLTNEPVSIETSLTLDLQEEGYINRIVRIGYRVIWS